MTRSRKITVLVVDDHALVREGIVSVLSGRPDVEVVAQAADAATALASYDRHTPDVTLMDLRLPGMDGIEAIARLAALHPEARVLALTTSGRNEDVTRALRAGALGYILKTVSTEELVRAIEAVHAGRRVVDPQLAADLLGDAPSALSPREREVLAGVVRGQSNKEIAARLGITVRTVKQHVNAMMSKLGVSSRTQAAVAALKRGLVPPE